MLKMLKMSKILQIDSRRINFHFSSVFHLKVQMSRYSSISLRAESGTVLSLAMTFTLIMWGLI